MVQPSAPTGWYWLHGTDEARFNETGNIQVMFVASNGELVHIEVDGTTLDPWYSTDVAQNWTKGTGLIPTSIKGGENDPRAYWYCQSKDILFITGDNSSSQISMWALAYNTSTHTLTELDDLQNIRSLGTARGLVGGVNPADSDEVYLCLLHDQSIGRMDSVLFDDGTDTLTSLGAPANPTTGYPAEDNSKGAFAFVYGVGDDRLSIPDPLNDTFYVCAQLSTDQEDVYVWDVDWNSSLTEYEWTSTPVAVFDDNQGTQACLGFWYNPTDDRFYAAISRDWAGTADDSLFIRKTDSNNPMTATWSTVYDSKTDDTWLPLWNSVWMDEQAAAQFSVAEQKIYVISNMSNDETYLFTYDIDGDSATRTDLDLSTVFFDDGGDLHLGYVQSHDFSNGKEVCVFVTYVEAAVGETYTIFYPVGSFDFDLSPAGGGFGMIPIGG